MKKIILTCFYFVLFIQYGVKQFGGTSAFNLVWSVSKNWLINQSKIRESNKWEAILYLGLDSLILLTKHISFYNVN